jgi:outer membrane protein assembly factor BamA
VGPFGNVRLKWRNPFGGAEVLELSGRAGLEGQLTQLGDNNNTTASTYTVQYGATVSLVVPQVLAPFHLGNLLRNYQPRTRFALSTTYTSSNYYTRSNTELTFDYIWQTSAYQQYIFTPVDLGIVRTRHISDFYQERLTELRVQQGSPLYRSFLPIYEPSVSFTSIYNSNDLNQTRNAHFLRIFAELGGISRNLYRNQKWFEDTGLSVYNFAKLTVDYRRYYKLSPNTYLAWRLNGGVAHALTKSLDPSPLPGQTATERYILPYDKYLFAGGSNSVRAWSPRRLGTGAYATLITDSVTKVTSRDYYTEQPGEVLLEGSVEYRFPVYSFIKGALFTDFGNVWSLQPDANRPGAEFRASSFYKQFAVGSGFGIRMDFTFLILRFDIATRVYDPTEVGQPWRLRNALKHTDNQTVVNVGLGYPF